MSRNVTGSMKKARPARTSDVVVHVFHPVEVNLPFLVLDPNVDM